MRLRLGAAAAGVALITAAVLGFALAAHPVVAGTNGIDPLYDTVFLRGGVPYCQQVPDLPSETSRVQVRVSRMSGATRSLRVVIVDRRGRIARGEAPVAGGGELTVELDRATPEHRIRHAGACFTNLDGGEIVLAGETKRNSAVPEAERNFLDDLGVVDSSAMRCFELPLQLFPFIVTTEEQVAVDALEVAIDILHRGD